jgi:hypothetical protein
VFVAWHIDKGSFGNVTLDGLNVSLAVQSPGHMLTTKWQAALYFDDKASEDQKNALMHIFTGQAGGHPATLVSFVGEVLGAKSVGMTYHADGKHRRMQIAEVVDVEIEAMSGPGDSDVTINGHPLAIAPGYAATVAKSKKLKYHDYGLQWEISEKNGFFSPFAYQAS